MSESHALVARKWRIVSRRQCQLLLLEMPPGLSRRQIDSALALQLQRLDDRANLEYAWSDPAPGRRHHLVWYWSNDKLEPRTCPEPLLYEGLRGDGPRLLQLSEGYELLYLLHGQIIKSRWLAERPDIKNWLQWCEDCGEPTQDQSIPKPFKPQYLRRPQTQWRIKRLPQNIGWSAPHIRTLLLLFFFGAVAGAAVYVPLALDLESKRLQVSLLDLRKQAGELAGIQKEVQRLLAQIEPVAAQVPASSQLEKLGRLADANILGAQDQPFLAEWDVQKDRIRMQIIIPAQNFTLDEFLQQLESMGMFQEIRLAPNPPRGSIVIQARIKT